MRTFQYEDANEGIKILADEISATNLKVAELSGRILALQSVLGDAVHALSSQSLLDILKNSGKTNIDALKAYRPEADDGTKRMIDAFIAETEGVLRLAEDQSPQPPLTVIRGGKED